MPKTPYAEDAPAVNPDYVRRETLRSLDLITTEQLMDALGCAKETLAILREFGLEQIGPGRQKFYRCSSVAAAMERAARRQNTEGMEAEGDE